jgi:serine/tyrosine/threonine adenylyltransferase
MSATDSLRDHRLRESGSRLLAKVDSSEVREYFVAVTASTRWGFEHTYAKLPPRFFASSTPTPVSAPKLLALNVPLAETLGLSPNLLRSEEGVRVLGGNLVPEDAQPIALAYAGHQFGSFAGRLGDGRAILLGERVGSDGIRRDIQLKGAGRTTFSRGGDGRAAMGPVLREYVVSEAMHALGIPTTRSLAAVATGDVVVREDPLPGAVLTRVAKSHVRVGTFELFASAGDEEALTHLVSFCLARHYPDAVDSEGPALALLDNVVQAQASLVAKWLGVGFIHGVMNTDNTSISGETIDYGPCAFLDVYRPDKVFSSIDRQGRYAYGAQPSIAAWNITRLAEALLPLIAKDEKRALTLATEALEKFSPAFSSAYREVFRAKIGLQTREDDDALLISDLLKAMASAESDFTVFFREFARGSALPASFASWKTRYDARVARESATRDEQKALMLRSNPAFIPRNHRIEEMIAQVIAHEDLSLFERLMRVLAKPFDDQPRDADLAAPPLPEQRVTATFCGT